ncbi:MAG: SLC13 family permease, partial [Syntrophomonas sp.]
MTEKIHRTVAVILGSTLVMAIGVISQEEAIKSVDFNTIWLLIGMMIIVG